MKKYGVDVAITRADDIDKKMVVYVTEHKGCSVLDLGCGGGGQSVRLANAGAEVLAIDVIDYSKEFHTLREKNDLQEKQLQFLKGDMVDLPTLVSDKQFDICCLQRTIHYLPYKQALLLLEYLRKIINDKLFISVTGIESDIGRNYMDKNKSVQARFCQLNNVDAMTFNINEPLCLYTPEEFMFLLQESGWEIEECWVSAFQNVKVVCS